MVKSIGMILIATSILSLMAGVFIDYQHGASAGITGSATSNIEHLKASSPIIEYLEATFLSYSILSLIMGLMFLFRV